MKINFTKEAVDAISSFIEEEQLDNSIRLVDDVFNKIVEGGHDGPNFTREEWEDYVVSLNLFRQQLRTLKTAVV